MNSYVCLVVPSFFDEIKMSTFVKFHFLYLYKADLSSSDWPENNSNSKFLLPFYRRAIYRQIDNTLTLPGIALEASTV